MGLIVDGEGGGKFSQVCFADGIEVSYGIMDTMMECAHLHMEHNQMPKMKSQLLAIDFPTMTTMTHQFIVIGEDTRVSIVKVASTSVAAGLMAVKQAHPRALQVLNYADAPAVRLYLSSKLSILDPIGPHQRLNWQYLLPFFNDLESFTTVFGRFIAASTQVATLFHWSRIVTELFITPTHPQDPRVDLIQTRIRELQAASRLQISDMSRQIAADADALLVPGPFRPTQPYLTAVNLNGETLMGVIQDLGQEFKLFRMIESSGREEAVKALQLHEIILDAMQESGFVLRGIRGQDDFTKAQASLYSLTAITAFLNAHPEVLRKLATTLLAIDITPFTPAASIEKMSGAERTAAIMEVIAASQPKEQRRLYLLIQSAILEKGKASHLRGELALMDKETRKEQMRLDQWQREMIGYIQKGLSVLVNGPTSGGKTFASMAAINWILEQTKAIPVRLLYCAPTAHLCIQTWASISATFPNTQVALICSIFSHIPDRATIYVGTPCELNVFLHATPQTFEIGIFDEVHMISTSFGHDTSTIERSEGIAAVMRCVTKQIVAISATIHAEDLPILQEFIAQQCGILAINGHRLPATTVGSVTTVPLATTPVRGDLIHRIVYPTRPVPLTRLIFERDHLTVSTPESVVPLVAITAETTFRMIKLLGDRLPALIFDDTDEACWNFFSDYVEWCENRDVEYAIWKDIHSKMEGVVAAYNTKAAEVEDAWIAAASSPRAELALMARIRPLEKMYNTTCQRVREVIGIGIDKALNQTSPFSATRVATTTVMGPDHVAMTFAAGRVVTPLVNDLLNVYDRYQDLVIDGGSRVRSRRTTCQDVAQDDAGGEEEGGRRSKGKAKVKQDAGCGEVVKPPPPMLKVPCSGVPPFYRIGNELAEVEEFRQLFTASTSRADQKARKQMQQLAQAERIRPDEAKPIFDLIIRGLEYGVGIILPTMPFVVQYQMLKLLTTKKLPVLFASQSMSMGINYPIKTVVIRSGDGLDMNVSEYLQMEGRAGRRGMDVEGFGLAWNITNAPTASLQTLPRLVLPEVRPNRGRLIAQPLLCAREIAISSINLGDMSSIERAVGNMSIDASSKLRTSDIRMGRLGMVDIGADDDAGADESDEEGIVTARPKTVKKATGVKSSLGDQTLASSIVGVIGPVMRYLGMDAIQIIEVTIRVQSIVVDKFDDVAEDAYMWAAVMNTVEQGIREVHTLLRTLPHAGALARDIASTHELLHRIQYRQMRVGQDQTVKTAVPVPLTNLPAPVIPARGLPFPL